MLKRLALSGAVIASVMAGIHAPAQADPEYVRVCDAYGEGYFYSPGTETCVHAETGETRRMSDAGTVYGETELAKRLGAVEHQSAISNALEDPDLSADEQFGLRVNWGAAGQKNALGITGTAVIPQNVFSGRIATSGGVGFSGGKVGGRAGVQVTW